MSKYTQSFFGLDGDQLPEGLMSSPDQQQAVGETTTNPTHFWESPSRRYSELSVRDTIYGESRTLENTEIIPGVSVLK